jgi:hypothetical protein
LHWAYERAIARQQRRYDPIAAAAASRQRSPERSEALKKLNSEYPASRADLLPTRLGNIIRSFERHPRQRYNLNGIYTYPRISPLLSEAERENITDARTDLAFFLNIALLAVATGAYVLADSVWHGWWDSLAVVPALLLPPVIYQAACSAALGAAHRWGAAVRAAFDLHRLELYEKIGLRRPTTQKEEEETANAVNRLLVYAERLPDNLREPIGPASNEREDSRSG